MLLSCTTGGSRRRAATALLARCTRQCITTRNTQQRQLTQMERHTHQRAFNSTAEPRADVDADAPAASVSDSTSSPLPLPLPLPSPSLPYSTLPASETTYVSSHWHVDPLDVLSYLDRKKLVYRVYADGSQLLIKDCPFCHPINNKPDNQWKLSIYFPNANHVCHRCKAKGSWYDMKKRLGDIKDRVVTLRDRTLQTNYIKGFPPIRQRRTETQTSTTNTETQTTPTTATTQDSEEAGEAATSATVPRPPRQPSQSSLSHYHKQLSSFPSIVSWLTVERGLRRDLLDLYHVGAGRFRFLSDEGVYVEEECVTFPWMRIKDCKIKKNTEAERATDSCTDTVDSKDSETPSPAVAASPPSSTLSASSPTFIIDRIKYRSMLHKHHQRMLPTGGNWGFFGYHAIPPNAESVILTEGEFDAIAAYQCTGVPAISLPNGASSLPVELLPFLERFKLIYLWMDDDRVGQEGAETFAKKLGIKRCYIVRTRQGSAEGPKDANEALLRGVDIPALLAASEPFPHQQITTFGELREDVFRELAEPEQRQGVQSTTLPTLNKILKGHRRGELTVITGSTGVGKTTVLSQLSLDYCAQGVNTLWGSFEIKNFKLAKTMLAQYCGLDLSLNMNQFDHYADQFEQLPMYFMRFFGSSSVEQVIDAMDYAVYMHDVQHIVLDNLQFLLSGQGDRFDKFDVQDRAISEFRHFATHKNVHITLVIHPRKEMGPLGVNSVFGSAKATQEADNVLIIQAPTPTPVIGGFARDSSGWVKERIGIAGDFDRFRRIQVMKNRYDGETGVVPFLYDRASSRIQEVDSEGKVIHRAQFARVVPMPVEMSNDSETKHATIVTGKAETKRVSRRAAAVGGIRVSAVPQFGPAPVFTQGSPFAGPFTASPAMDKEPHQQPTGNRDLHNPSSASSRASSPPLRPSTLGSVSAQEDDSANARIQAMADLALDQEALSTELDASSFSAQDADADGEVETVRHFERLSTSREKKAKKPASAGKKHAKMEK